MTLPNNDRALVRFAERVNDTFSDAVRAAAGSLASARGRVLLITKDDVPSLHFVLALGRTDGPETLVTVAEVQYVGDNDKDILNRVVPEVATSAVRRFVEPSCALLADRFRLMGTAVREALIVDFERHGYVPLVKHPLDFRGFPPGIVYEVLDNKTNEPLGEFSATLVMDEVGLPCIRVLIEGGGLPRTLAFGRGTVPAILGWLREVRKAAPVGA